MADGKEKMPDQMLPFLWVSLESTSSDVLGFLIDQDCVLMALIASRKARR